MKKKLALIMCLAVCATSISGCKKENGGENAVSGDMSINFGDYKDSEDIPDWTGKKIKVSVWQDAGATNAYLRYKESPDDVVTPEFERITGVTFDSDNSFDNAGNSFDAKITQVIASGDFPAMAYSLPELSDLVKSGALYDLTEYVEKYCPNVMKFFGPDTVYGNIWKYQKEKYGGMYAIPTGIQKSAVRDMTKIDKTYNLTDEEIENICGVSSSPHGYVYVRDDILKMIYPEAHTLAELEDIYNKNGEFTEEEIFDVPLNSPQDFIDFLYKVDKLELPDDGNGKCYTTFTHVGTDNWMPCSVMLPLFGYSGQYFNYYDLEKNQMQYTFKSDWFKDILKTYNKLVRDDVASKEALLDTQKGFDEKYTNGRYLVSLKSTPPTGNMNNKYRYRKVYMKYTNGYDKVLSAGTGFDGDKKISFFKNGISEEDLIQTLRYIDFAVSLPGQKLTYFGPKSAGLYTEDENGKLAYKDEDLKNQCIDSNAYGNDLVVKYGLIVGPWPGRPIIDASMYRPSRFYSSKRDMESAFNAGYVDPIVYPYYADSAIYGETAAIPEVKKFWQARDAFEDSLTQVFAAENDAQFEERYKNMVDQAERTGLTDETLQKYQELWETDNKLYMDNINKYKEEIKNR